MKNPGQQHQEFMKHQQEQARKQQEMGAYYEQMNRKEKRKNKPKSRKEINKDTSFVSQELEFSRVEMDTLYIQEFTSRRRKMASARFLGVLAYVAVIAIFFMTKEFVITLIAVLFWMLFMVVYAFYQKRIWRCPNCEETLNRHNLRPKHCKNCGARLR